MLINIRYTEVKGRRHDSHLFKGHEKFTGSVTYAVAGSVDREPVRLSLGTEEKGAAIRSVRKIEKACAEGSKSSLWHDLEESLPPKTFRFFADRAGYIGASKTTVNKVLYGHRVSWYLSRIVSGDIRTTRSGKN